MAEKWDIVDQILRCKIELKDEVEMKLMDDEKMARYNVWRTHDEVTDGLSKSRGKIYSLLLGQCTQVLVDKMKQDVDWTMVSDSFDPIALFKLIEKFVLKQSDNQYRTAVLIAEQLSILQFHQDDQVMNATYYDRFTTRVEVAKQKGVCYYTPDLLKAKATELKLTVSYANLMQPEQETIKEAVEQEYPAYLFLNNSSQKMHSQLKKNVANDYSKGNQNAYPTDIHKALTLMNEYKPLKLDSPAPVAAQGTAFATKGSQRRSKKGSSKKYYSDAEWKALSPEAQTKIINDRKKAMDDTDDDKSAASAKSS